MTDKSSLRMDPVPGGAGTLELQSEGVSASGGGTSSLDLCCSSPSYFRFISRWNLGARNHVELVWEEMAPNCGQDTWT